MTGKGNDRLQSQTRSVENQNREGHVIIFAGNIAVILGKLNCTHSLIGRSGLLEAWLHSWNFVASASHVLEQFDVLASKSVFLLKHSHFLSIDQCLRAVDVSNILPSQSIQKSQLLVIRANSHKQAII